MIPQTEAPQALERLIAEGLHLARKRKLQTELVCDNTCKLPSRNAGTVGKFLQLRHGFAAGVLQHLLCTE